MEYVSGGLDDDAFLETALRVSPANLRRVKAANRRMFLSMRCSGCGQSK